MLKERELLESNLIEAISKVKHDKSKVKKIKKGMKEYNFTPGEVQAYFHDTEDKLPELDLRILCLLTQEIYITTLEDNIKPDTYFTETELKQARTFDYSLVKEFEEVSFPIVLDKVIMIDSENYITVWDIHFIKKLMDNQLLRYNFDTQREHIKIKRNNSIQKGINVNAKSVKEIEESTLNGELQITTITINALVGTSDEDEELTYDAKKMQLSVHEGAFLDVVDGFHRITGALNALEVDPEINQVFQVAIKNFNIKQAQKHLAQISKINEINKTHIEALEASRKSDLVVKQLQRESDLRGKISQTNRIRYKVGELVSYNTLADTIEEEFDMKTKMDATEIGEYLIEFFDHLIGSYPEEFLDGNKNESLMSENIMFAGYVILARKMKDEGVSLSKLKKIIDSIDFDKENIDWVTLNVLDVEGNKSPTAKTNVKKFFRSLELNVD